MTVELWRLRRLSWTCVNPRSLRFRDRCSTDDGRRRFLTSVCDVYFFNRLFMKLTQKSICKCQSKRYTRLLKLTHWMKLRQENVSGKCCWRLTCYAAVKSPVKRQKQATGVVSLLIEARRSHLLRFIFVLEESDQTRDRARVVVVDGLRSSLAWRRDASRPDDVTQFTRKQTRASYIKSFYVFNFLDNKQHFHPCVEELSQLQDCKKRFSTTIARPQLREQTFQ